MVGSRETTEIKVELAKCEERLRNLQSRMKQFEENRQERHRAIDEAREHLAECMKRGEASRWSILRAEAEIADLYLRKETFAAQTVDLVNCRETLQAATHVADSRGSKDPRSHPQAGRKDPRR